MFSSANSWSCSRVSDSLISASSAGGRAFACHVVGGFEFEWTPFMTLIVELASSSSSSSFPPPGGRFVDNTELSLPPAVVLSDILAAAAKLPRLICSTLLLFSNSLSTLFSTIPLCTSPAPSNFLPRYQTTLSLQAPVVFIFPSSCSSIGSAISPFAHRRNAPPRFRRRISRSVSCRRRSAVTSCCIDPARVERRDLVSVSIWSR